MDFYFTDEERPDLASLEVSAPEGFIADEILPIVPVLDQTGTVYYMAAVSDVTAQTGRTAGAAPTATRISDSSTTFTTAEAIKDGAITPDEVKQMGGLDKAAIVGTKFAKRSVMRYRESDVAALILASGAAADNAFDPAKVQTDVQDALDAMELYEGRRVLIASTWVLKAMRQQMLLDGTYGESIARMVGARGGAEGLRQAGLDEWKRALAAWFGLDEVKAGNSGIWNATAIQGRFAIAVIDDDPDSMSHKYKPVLGKTYQFLPDGEQPYYIRTIPDTKNEDNRVRAKAKYDAILLNSGAVYVFDGVAG